MTPSVPLMAPRRDRVLPILVAASLAVHATIVVPALFAPLRSDAPETREIPVEIVQLPPPPKPAPPKPAPPKPAPPKPKPKPESPKPEPPKPAPRKPPAPKPPAPKPQPPKPAAVKPSASDNSPMRGEEQLKRLLGTMPAIALPSASEEGTEVVSYPQLVLSKVAKAKKEGHYRGIPGAASVTFTLGDAGDVASVAIVRPSGDPSLDAEAIAMIQRGAPYPPPPPGARRTYTITLRFAPLI